MPFDFLAPIHEELIASAANLPEQTLGRNMQLHSHVSAMPNLDGVKIALVGVLKLN